MSDEAEASARTPLRMRVAVDEDLPAILRLAEASLRWDPADPNEAFFRWKHLENPAGRSPMWVAEDDDGRIVGLRAFLRWRWRRQDGSAVSAVRAVDTATHPDHQGRGIFRRLTLASVHDLRAAGVAFVFNTPNDQSRPGYLKMGWQVLGRVPLAVGVRSPLALGAMARARAAAAKWSAGAPLGETADVLLADEEAVAALLTARAAPRVLETERTLAFWRWRYGFGPLGYRLVPAGRTVADGFAVYRLRRRGEATEATVCDVVVPARARRTASRLVRQIIGDGGGDYVVLAAGAAGHVGPTLPVQRLGPVLTWRALADAERPSLARWALTLGDVELF